MIKRLKVKHVGLALVSLLILAALTLSGVSLSNSIQPAGIIIHHAAIPPQPGGPPVDAAFIDHVHRMRGYRVFYWGRYYHVGFHYVILPDGTVEEGRPEHCRGAHTIGYNSYVGICLIGNFSSKDNPDGEGGLTQPTSAQLEALTVLCRKLRERYGFPVENVLRHSDATQGSECPGDRFRFAELIDKLK